MEHRRGVFSPLVMSTSMLLGQPNYYSNTSINDLDYTIQFSPIEDPNSHHRSQRNSTAYLESKGSCQPHTILKRTEKPKESIRNLKPICGSLRLTTQMTGPNTF